MRVIVINRPLFRFPTLVFFFRTLFGFSFNFKVESQFDDGEYVDSLANPCVMSSSTFAILVIIITTITLIFNRRKLEGLERGI